VSLTFGDWLLVALGVLTGVIGFMLIGEGCVAWGENPRRLFSLLGAPCGLTLMLFGLFLSWLGVRGAAGRLVRRGR